MDGHLPVLGESPANSRMVIPIGPAWPVWPSLIEFGVGCPCLDPFDNVWSLLTPFGPIWPRFAPFGLVWPHLALFSPVWPHLAPFDLIWPHLAPLGPAWPHLACLTTFDLVWCCLTPSGSIYPCFALFGTPFKLSLTHLTSLAQLYRRLPLFTTIKSYLSMFKSFGCV